MENRDQLYQLRKIVSHAEKKEGKIIAVASGKGGVGKSTLALNLSLALAQSNDRVLLIDADHCLPDLHVLMGVAPAKKLRDVVAGKEQIKGIILQHETGLHIAFSGKSDLKNEHHQLNFTESFFSELKSLQNQYEYIVVDTAAGISEPVVNIGVNVDDVLIVTTPEPAAISDSYALVKILSGMDRNIHFHTLINWVQSDEQAQEVYENFSLVIDHFLKIKNDYWGYLLQDKHVRMSAERQKPFILEWPKCRASKCIYQIAKEISL